MASFTYKNTSISYQENGKGNAVILLHGFLGSKEIWNSIYKFLSQRYRVICIDLLGHGQSDSLGYIHSMEDQADMIFSLISHLKLRKVSLVGHSMGGYVSLAFAELYPDMLRHLILVNSSAFADSQERKNNREHAIEVVKKNCKTFIRVAISNLFSQETHQLKKEEIKTCLTLGQKTSMQGIIAGLEGMKIRPDREILLHFSPYPKLIIAGISDNIITKEEVSQQVKDSETQAIFIDGGHMLPLEQPEKISELLKNFLKK